jgi:hypothetical protein
VSAKRHSWALRAYRFDTPTDQRILASVQRRTGPAWLCQDCGIQKFGRRPGVRPWDFQAPLCEMVIAKAVMET